MGRRKFSTMLTIHLAEMIPTACIATYLIVTHLLALLLHEPGKNGVEEVNRFTRKFGEMGIELGGGGETADVISYRYLSFIED